MEENNQPDNSSQDHNEAGHERPRQPHQLFSDHKSEVEHNEPNVPSPEAFVPPAAPLPPPIQAAAPPVQQPQPQAPAYNSQPFAQPNPTNS